MAHDRTAPPGRMTLMPLPHRAQQADYSYDQWRRAQMRQQEAGYAEMTGVWRKPAAA